MKPLKSITTKIKSLAKKGFTDIKTGKYNLENPNPKTEKLAIERLKTCKECTDFKTEPITFLQIIDKNIPELSRKYCRQCGCALPYKTRQNNQICTKWKQ